MRGGNLVAVWLALHPDQLLRHRAAELVTQGLGKVTPRRICDWRAGRAGIPEPVQEYMRLRILSRLLGPSAGRAAAQLMRLPTRRIHRKTDASLRS